MVREIYKHICQGEDVRSNLIKLRELIKNPLEKRNFAYFLEGDFTVLGKLLDHEDAKVRKNAARILGEMECEDVLSKLFEAYRRESQLFVREDYLRAMENLDYRDYLPKLRRRQKQLMEELDLVSQDKRKHLRKEAAVLSQMILKYDGHRRHSFVGGEAKDVILLCNRLHRQVTAQQVRTGKTVLLAGGVRVLDGNLEELLKIRTWTEAFFPLHKAAVGRADPEEIARAVAGSDLMELLETLHGEGGAFLFRLDYRGSMAPEKKGAFLKKTAALLEEESGRQLVNSVSDYEIEIRLVENRQGGIMPLLRCGTLEDRRFAYRREAGAGSISPVNAALIMRLAGEYLRENAQVLDPCCGVGTMLIERNYFRSADPLYGVDIFGEAIKMARINSECARMPIHYINRDFFQFEHGYLFDEVVTDLPPAADESFYTSFFRKTEELLKDGGILVLYNQNGGLLERMCHQWENMKILKTEMLNERKNSLLIVGRLQKHK